MAILAIISANLSLFLSSPTSASTTDSIGGTFVPITPIRIADSRCDFGIHPLFSGSVQKIHIEGAIGFIDQPFCNSESYSSTTTTSIPYDQNVSSGPQEISSGIPASGVLGVVLNVTVVNSSTTNGGYLEISPLHLGGVVSSTSNIDYLPGETVASQVTTGLSNSGDIYVENFLYSNDSSRVDVIIDAMGYYSTNSSYGSSYYPLASPQIIANNALASCGSGSYFPSSTAFPLMPTSSTNLLSVPIFGEYSQSQTTCYRFF